MVIENIVTKMSFQCQLSFFKLCLSAFAAAQGQGRHHPIASKILNSNHMHLVHSGNLLIFLIGDSTLSVFHW